jgi:hypothetical protein
LCFEPRMTIWIFLVWYYKSLQFCKMFQSSLASAIDLKK